MDFYSKVKNAIRQEPAKDVKIDEEESGPQIWMYGYSVYSKSDAVVIHQTTKNYTEKWQFGRREATLEFGPDPNSLIVGWQVISNWGDGTNGTWYKANDQILMTNHGAVHVRSEYDRGCDWSVVFYFVDAEDYQF
jgi:hypothetical protein